MMMSAKEPLEPVTLDRPADGSLVRDISSARSSKKERTFSFPKERRIRLRAEFLLMQNTRARCHTAHFLLIFALNSFERSRLGLTVTKKIGNAVVRNRIKRVAREAFRLQPDWLPPGIDMLAIAKPGAENLGLVSLMEEWMKAKAQINKIVRTLRQKADGRLDR